MPKWSLSQPNFLLNAVGKVARGARDQWRPWLVAAPAGTDTNLGACLGTVSCSHF
jgi:hypothetical protein